MHKAGGVAVPPAQLLRCIRIATTHAVDMVAKLRKVGAPCRLRSAFPFQFLLVFSADGEWLERQLSESRPCFPLGAMTRRRRRTGWRLSRPASAASEPRAPRWWWRRRCPLRLQIWARQTPLPRLHLEAPQGLPPTRTWCEPLSVNLFVALSWSSVRSLVCIARVLRISVRKRHRLATGGRGG